MAGRTMTLRLALEERGGWLVSETMTTCVKLPNVRFPASVTTPIWLSIASTPVSMPYRSGPPFCPVAVTTVTTLPRGRFCGR